MILNHIDKNKILIEDKKLSITIISIVIVLTVQFFVLVFLGEHSLFTSKIGIISKLIVGFMFIKSLPIVLRRNILFFILTYLISFSIILLNILIFPENIKYICDIFFNFVFICLPTFCYIMSIYDLKIFMRIVFKGSKIIAIFGILIGIMVFTGYSSIGIYNMGFSYYMLFPIILFLYDYFEKRNLWSLSISLVLIVIILALGARGPLLSIIIFCVLYHAISVKKKSFNNLMKTIFFMLIIFVALIFYRQILMYISEILLRYGINSRSINLLLRENVSLSNRDIIYSKIINSIYSNPIKGLGLAGDRVILNGIYAHNLFLELVSNFGVIFGLPISVGLVIHILWTISSVSLNKAKAIIVWFSIGFIPLMMSSSLFIFYQFWIYLGFVVNLTNKNEIY